MTQEDKELIFRDLCARLPYKPKFRWYFPDGTEKIDELKDLSDLMIFWITKSENAEIKPYLRSCSNMTEKEYNTYFKTEAQYFDESYSRHWIDTIDTYDFLNRNHFDYRGLIEKGLAIEAPDGMYNI